MKYEKRLIILTGEGGKGTLKLERNAYGLRGELNVGLSLSSVTLLAIGERGEDAYPVRLSGGRGTLSLSPDLDVSTAHFALYDGKGRAAMYGTLAKTRIWPGNLRVRDGGRKESEFEKSKTAETYSQEEGFAYSRRADLFSDIFPAGGAQYADNAVAQVNYYAPDPSLSPDGGTEEFSPKCAAENAAKCAAENGALPAEESKRVSPQPPVEEGKRVSSQPSAEEGKRVSPQPSAQLSVEDVKRVSEEEAERVIPGAAGGKGEVRGRKMTFYERVSEQVETLFSEHPREEALEKLLPFTRWARVEFADDGRYYVVGLVGERPDYLCYGLPGEYASDAPGGASWLPLDVRDPHGKGYWLLYQDAATGKSVSLSGWDGE